MKLQAGDEENLRIWREMSRLSRMQFDKLYSRLGVTFDHTLGESFYNPQLKAVVEELRGKGIAHESEGAIGVFSDGSLPPKDDPFLKTEDGELKPNPFLIQKSDGAANYATTDLATLEYRLARWDPQDRSGGSAATESRPPGPDPWGRRGDLNSPAGPHRSPKYGWY